MDKKVLIDFDTTNSVVFNGYTLQFKKQKKCSKKNSTDVPKIFDRK